MLNSRFHGVFGPLLGGKVPVKEERKAGLPAEAQRAQAGQPRLTGGQLALDIFDEDVYLIIKAPIAGVKLADIDIDVVDNVITIHGKREQCDELTDDQYYVQECYWGEFSRSVTLPFVVNPSRVKATFSKDNILKIYVPKEERKVKIVKINEGG